MTAVVRAVAVGATLILLTYLPAAAQHRGGGFHGGGEDYIRLAFSYEQPDKCYEGSRLLARAILDARSV